MRDQVKGLGTERGLDSLGICGANPSIADGSEDPALACTAPAMWHAIRFSDLDMSAMSCTSCDGHVPNLPEGFVVHRYGADCEVPGALAFIEPGPDGVPVSWCAFPDDMEVDRG